jgi:hypothetical protein
MAAPLYIAQCGRLSGRSWLRVVGHGLTAGDAASKSVQVVGVSEQTMNGTFRLSKVIPPDHLEYLQPGLHDIVGGLAGGAVGIS